MPNISRGVIDSLLSNGSAFALEQDGDFNLMLDGIADNAELVCIALSLISKIRDPYYTPILSDLEIEYGIQTDLRLSDEIRREKLSALIYRKRNTGSRDNLQNALNLAGFDVQVHENSPAVDPDIFLNSIPLMVAGGDNAYAAYIPGGGGPSTAVAGRTGGELLVNGNIYYQSPDYVSVANGDNMFAGNSQAFSGNYFTMRQTSITYLIPDDPNAWPFIFFVGGDATRDPVTGELTAILNADIPAERENDFKRLILKYKPIHSWAGLLINYI